MAFRTIDENDVKSGRPIQEDLVSTFRENEENLNERVSSLEGAQSSGAVFIANGSIHSGNYFDSLEGVVRYQARSPLRIITAVISKVGTTVLSETLEMDILTSETVNGTYTSIMSVNPSISGTSSDDSSSNAAFSNANVAQNHWIRVDITSTIANISEIHLLVIAEAT